MYVHISTDPDPRQNSEDTTRSRSATLKVKLKQKATTAKIVLRIKFKTLPKVSAAPAKSIQQQADMNSSMTKSVGFGLGIRVEWHGKF